SFTPEKIEENVHEMVQTIVKLKPASAKGTYIKSINLSTTMSPAITIDKNSISGI
ncbi:MAG: 50S ribosomal protein L1, partial [Cytophagales bacterium]|nr:50S ribosomal protein L1 [Cytophagales bacterium]